MAKKTYESKAVITTIKASSRQSIKLGDSYCTVEYTEERSLPEDCDIEKEKEELWKVVNNERDIQIETLYDQYTKSRKK